MSVFHCGRHLDLNCEIYVIAGLFLQKKKYDLFYNLACSFYRKSRYTGEFQLQVQSIRTDFATCLYRYVNTSFLYVQGWRCLTLIPLLHWALYPDSHWNLPFVFYVNAHNNVNTFPSISAQATLVHCSVSAEQVLTSSGYSPMRFMIWTVFPARSWWQTKKRKKGKLVHCPVKKKEKKKQSLSSSGNITIQAAYYNPYLLLGGDL